jgi:Cell division septal protein
VTGSSRPVTGPPSPGGRSVARRWRLVRARGEVPRRRVIGRPRRRASRGVLLGLLGAVVVAGTAWALLGTSLLGVRHVEISGVEVATQEAVRDAAAVTLGTSLLRLDTRAIAARVEALPPVAHADVRRSFPHTLVITVTERTPAAVVPAADGGYAVLAADGVVYHHVAEPLPGIPVVRLETPGPGDPATLAALRVVAALTPELRAVLAELRAPTPTGITLALVDGRTIVWGDAEASDRKAAVATVLLAEDATTIDVSVPDIATVR